MRFFSSSAAVYEQVRASLDAAWGLPNGLGTATCIEPADTAPRDGQGRVVLAVHNSFCEFPAVAEVLPQLLASGAVDEITAADYQAAVGPVEP
jgi:hypothetical protein